MIVLDDIENDENVNTPDQRKKLKSWFEKAVSKAGDTYTDIMYIGTVLHYDSLLNNVLQNPRYHARKYRAVISWAVNQKLWDEWESIYINLFNENHEDDARAFYESNKDAMMEGVEVNGKMMYLSNFGINTLNYFTSADNEKNAYHIDGDPDDANTSGNADRLKSMIANDPDTVVSFFTQLSKKLYNEMFDQMKAKEGYSSAMNFYDDKKMQEDYDDYTAKIKELEKKLADYEDKWYAKFAAMETALAKMQNNASAVTSLLGG